MHEVESYLRFKTTELRDQWLNGNLSPALKVKVLLAAWWHFQEFKQPAVITSLIRDDGIHKERRAADLRTSHISVFAHKWEAWLNSVFPYQGKAGCNTALVHEVKKCIQCGKHFPVTKARCPKCGAIGDKLGTHIHIQVGPKEGKPDTPANYVV